MNAVKILFLVVGLFLSVFAQVGNFDLTDLDGTTYNLYDDLLDKGRPVYVEAMFDG